MNRNLKVGDKWSRISYGEIVDINGRDVQVKNEKGESWWISGDLIQKEFDLATPYVSTEKVSQTALSDVLLSNPGIVMTVNFNKKVTEKDATSVIDSYVEGYPESSAAISSKDIAKKILTGEERVIIGRHYHQVDEFGRVQFIDMQLEKDESKDYDTRLRKVDPRTINWIIINNVRYIKK